MNNYQKQLDLDCEREGEALWRAKQFMPRKINDGRSGSSRISRFAGNVPIRIRKNQIDPYDFIKEL